MDFYEPILPADLPSGARLRPNEGAEGVDLFDDQFLHPFDRLLCLKAKVEFLFERGDEITEHQLLQSNPTSIYIVLTASQIGSSDGSCHTARYG